MEHSPGFLALVDARRAHVHELTVEETRRALAAHQAAHEAALLIDVREDREFATAHAQGAIHVARGVLERDIERLVPDKDTPLYLYCGGGFRSALAADAIQQMGYRAVRSVAGGWRAWQEAGAPTESPIDPIDLLANQLRVAGFTVLRGLDDGEGDPTVLIETEDAIFQIMALGPRRLIP